MKNSYYSYCCGKFVEKNKERTDLISEGLIPQKGYHCSRCKKPLTVYGNPILEEDKQTLRDKEKRIRKENGIRGSLIEVKPNGDLYLINKLYKKAELGISYPNLVETWVIFDYYGNYLTAIQVEHKSGAFYIENESLKERMKKAKLCAVSLMYYNFDKERLEINKIDDFKNNPIFKQSLINRGWKFDSNGKLK